MDIQLHVTDEELKEFPEDIPDSGIVPSSISIPKADLPIPPIDLSIPPASLPRAKAKHKAKGTNVCHIRKSNSIHSTAQTLSQPSAPPLLLFLNIRPNYRHSLGHSLGHSLPKPGNTYTSAFILVSVYQTSEWQWQYELQMALC